MKLTTEESELITRNVECAVNVLVSQIRRALYEHPPGLTQKPVYTIKNFFPLAIHRVFNSVNLSCNFDGLSPDVLEDVIKNHQTVYYKVLCIRGQAGAGKTSQLTALLSQFPVYITAKRRDTVKHGHDSVLFYPTDNPQTMAKLQNMTNAELPPNFYRDPLKFTTHKEAQVYAILSDVANYYKHLKYLVEFSAKLSGVLLRYWEISDAAVEYFSKRKELVKGNLNSFREETDMGHAYCNQNGIPFFHTDNTREEIKQVIHRKYGGKTATSAVEQRQQWANGANRKRKSTIQVCDPNLTSPSKKPKTDTPTVTEQQRQQLGEMIDFAALHKEWKGLSKAMEGCSVEELMDICNSANVEVPLLLKYNVFLIEEAGICNWYQLEQLALVHQMFKSLLGMDQDVYPVFIVSGSESQSSAVRTETNVGCTESDSKRINDMSILEYVRRPFAREATCQGENSTFLFYTNKRNRIHKLDKALQTFNLGLRDQSCIEAFDDYVVNYKSLVDPACELQDRRYADYIRIFASNKMVNNYTNECINVLPSKQLKINTFLNLLDFNAFYENDKAYRERLANPDRDNYSGYQEESREDDEEFLLDRRDDEDYFAYRNNKNISEIPVLNAYIKNWFTQNEILGISGEFVPDNVRPVGEEFEIKGNYWPALNFPGRSSGHIMNPLKEEHWKPLLEDEGEIVQGEWEGEAEQEEEEFVDDTSENGLLLTSMLGDESLAIFISDGDKDDADYRNQRRKKGKSTLLDPWVYPKITQRYQLYVSDTGILLGKLAVIEGNAKFLVTGFKGTVARFVDLAASDVYWENLSDRPQFLFIMVKQAMEYIVQMADIKSYRDFIPLEAQTGREYEHDEAPWDEIDPIIEIPSKRQIAYLLYDLSLLRNYVQENSPFVMDQCLELHVLDLTNGDKYDSIEGLKRYMYMSGTIEKNERVITKNVVDVPVNGQFIDNPNAWYHNTPNILLQATKDYIRCQGVVVHCGDSGLVGVVLPNHYVYTSTGKSSSEKFALSLTMRVPIKKEVATTVQRIQGKTVPNVALVITPGMLHSHKSVFVSTTRHQYGLCMTENAYKKCKFIPQQCELEAMVSPYTFHCY